MLTVADVLRAGAGAGLALSSRDRLLLLFLLSSDERAARAAWVEWKKERAISDATFAELQMFPAAAARLVALGIEDAELRRMQGVARYFWLWHQRTTRAAVEATAALAAAGVPVMALKGLALHALGVSPRAERPLTDADILVGGELERSAELLAARGFRVRRRQRHAWTSARGAQEELDLHRFPLHQDGASDGWTRSGAQAVARSPFGAPARAHLIIHACSHGVRRTSSLQWALDVRRVLRALSVDWGSLLRVARDRRHGLVLADTLGALAEFGAPVPPAVLQSLGAEPISALEALEYVGVLAGSNGPWRSSADVAVRIMRDLRASPEPLGIELLEATTRRAELKWQSHWLSNWRRAGVARI